MCQVREFEVGLGAIRVVTGPSILSISGIGSCIGLAVRDMKCGVSGLAHIVLPNSEEGYDIDVTPGRYADTAVKALVREMISNGAQVAHVVAKLVGGSHALSAGGFDGSKNIGSVRKELAENNIPIAAEEVGSTFGRSMKFDTGNGKITIRRFQVSSGVAELKDTIVI